MQTFLQTGRSIVPISVDKALERAPWFNRIVGAAISAEDVQSLADGVPSKPVLTRIESSFRFTKRNQRVQIGFAVASLGLLALIGVSSWSTWQARSSQQAAVTSAAQAKVAQQTAQTEAERAQAQEAIARLSLQPVYPLFPP